MICNSDVRCPLDWSSGVLGFDGRRQVFRTIPHILPVLISQFAAISCVMSGVYLGYQVQRTSP